MCGAVGRKWAGDSRTVANRSKFFRVSDVPASGAGQEILVVDGDEQVVKGLDRLLTRVGLTVTGTGDHSRARDQLLNKYFAVALIDVDTPTPGGGLELLQFARDKAPLMSVIMMTNRRSFDTAVKSFRGGALDVVLKEPEVVPYLRERVLDAATDVKSGAERVALLEEIAESHEDFLRKMREMSKTITDMEDRILGRSKTGERAAISSDPVDVVVVDDDPEAVARFQRVLPESQGWRFFAAFTGGEALDHVTQQRPHIVIVKEHLPDLPGTMVVKSVKSGAPDAITLLYTPPVRGGQGGAVKMLEGSRVINLLPSYSTPEQLVSAMNEIREALHQGAKERRYLQAFRQRNFEFLQRYNSIKQRVAIQLEQSKKERR
jgi:DNA-binding NtrC family response regulator